MHVPQAYGYYASGSESESTLRDNMASFKRYRLVPRLMVDVSKVDTTVKLLGEALACTAIAWNTPRQAGSAGKGFSLHYNTA